MKETLKKFAPLLVTSCIAGVILSILGPFGTSRLSFLERIVYWVGLCAAGGVGAGLSDLLAQKLKWSLTVWQQMIGQSIGSTLMVCAFLFGMWPPTSILGVILTLFYVWIVAIVICGVGALMRQAKAQTHTDKIMPERASLLERLPPKLRSAEIYAISAEDHYVRVHSALGDEMILMRLSDAIKETAPLKGVQTHRSWWVAEKGVETVQRKDGKTSITLKNGVVAAVSRNGAKAVKDAGWL